MSRYRINFDFYNLGQKGDIWVPPKNLCQKGANLCKKTIMRSQRDKSDADTPRGKSMTRKKRKSGEFDHWIWIQEPKSDAQL